MGQSTYRDTCSWCGRGTNKLQTRKDGSHTIGLCPTCCPDLDETALPDTETLPGAWHHLTEAQREAWLDGKRVEDILREAYENGDLQPPTPR